MHFLHDHLANVLYVGRHVLLDICNCCVLYNFLGLNSINFSDAVHQYIVSAWPASSFSSSGVAPTTDDVYYVHSLSRFSVVCLQSYES